MLNARGATLAGPTLTLDGVTPSAILFTSRPTRGAGHMTTPELLDLWTTGSFAKDPPNATVSAFAKDGSKVSDAVVVLRAPKRDGDKVTFDVQVLEGSLANADGPASVFIDTIWFGVGSGGFTYLGQSQTTGGTRRHRQPLRHQHPDRLVQPGARRTASAAHARPTRTARTRRPTSTSATTTTTSQLRLPPLLPCF